MGFWDRFNSSAKDEPKENSDANAAEKPDEQNTDTDGVAENLTTDKPQTSRSGAFAIADKLTYERLHAALQRAELSFAVFPDNLIILLFPGGNIRIQITSDEVPILLVVGEWHVEIPIHARGEVLNKCMEINANAILPCCYVRTDDKGDITICADVATPFEKGCTDRQLDVALAAAIGSISSLFQHLKETYPDERFGSDPLNTGV